MANLSGLIRRLRSDASGNALLITAFAMPALIGSAGMATDFAQWYMWKRELQFAVDQAALAGAYAKASTDTTTRAAYSTLAGNAYNANVSQVVASKGVTASGPAIALAKYNGSATDNSVTVSATASAKLPFSSYFMDGPTTVKATAQATFGQAVNFTACMLAVNKTQSAAFQLGNSVTGSSACGVGALSNNAKSAAKETGDTNIPLGTVVAGGDVDSTFSNNGTVYKNQSGLSDPFESLSAPSSSGQPTQTYPSSCPTATPESTTYAADGMTWTHYTYTYYKGSNSNNWTVQPGYTGTGYIAPSWSPAPDSGFTNGIAFTGRSVSASTTTGLQAESAVAAGTPVTLTGSGSNKYWRVSNTSTRDKNTSIATTTVPATDGVVHLSPGVYGSIAISCKTEFAPGIYWISGNLDFGQNLTVTGTGGVMFVMTGSAGSISINSNSQVSLSGITAATLTGSYGYSAADADKIAGMMVFDPNSTTAMTFNGNSNLFMSGIFYMPKRDITFNGNSTVTTDSTNCLMVAANTIKITGNFSLNNFCVTTGGSALSIGGTGASVKLVG